MRKLTHKWLFTQAVALTACIALIAVPAFALPSQETSAAPVAGPAATEAGALQAPADPTAEAFRSDLAGKQAKLDELEAQLDGLDRELAIASEAYNKALVDLDTLQRKLEETRSDLANAEVACAIQQDTLSERARDIYASGEFNVLEVLLGSKSVSDFVARIRFLQSIGVSDANIASALAAQRDQIARTAADLEAREASAKSLKFELDARRIEVALRIQEREALLSSAQTDLLALLETRAAARQAGEYELLRQVLAGASDVGIAVQPGSPVETALAYHGVPYLWGGTTPAGFDCSGLVMYVFRQHGVDLPHYSGAQFLAGRKVEPADLQPGDVVFFGSPIYHTGIYAGAGYFIHAPRTGDFVKLSRLTDRSDYAGARRYDWAPRQSAAIDPATTVQ